MMSFACTYCDSPCPVGGDTTVIFSADGAAGALCGPQCAHALRAAHPELEPLLDAHVHGAHAASSLFEALGQLRRARGHAREYAAMPLLNAALFFGGAPLRVDTGGSATEQVVIMDAALDAKEPLQQAVLHLCALQAHGADVREILSDVGSCDVGRIGADAVVAADRLDAMIERARAAGRRLHDLGFRPAHVALDVEAPAAPAPVRPRAPQRSFLVRHHGAFGVLAILGALGATTIALLGALSLARTPEQARPTTVPCGSRLSARAGEWLRLEACSADLDHATQEVRVNRRTSEVESRGSIFVPVSPPSETPPSEPWAYVSYGSHRDLSDVAARTVFEGVLDDRRERGRPVLIEGHTPARARLFSWVVVGLGLAGLVLAAALAAAFFVGKRRAYREMIDER